MNYKLIQKVLAAMLIVNMVILFAIYNKANVPSMVTLDTKQIINHMLTQNKAHIDKEVDTVETMSACLSEVIEEYAKHHRVVIFPRQAAIAGNKDVTSEIKHVMQKKCLHD